MCFPRWHSDACFATLIGGQGTYAVTPLARFVWGGYYEHGLIWRNRWVTDDGTVECRDALALPVHPTARHHPAPDPGAVRERRACASCSTRGARSGASG